LLGAEMQRRTPQPLELVDHERPRPPQLDRQRRELPADQGAAQLQIHADQSVDRFDRNLGRRLHDEMILRPAPEELILDGIADHVREALHAFECLLERRTRRQAIAQCMKHRVLVLLGQFEAECGISGRRERKAP